MDEPMAGGNMNAVVRRGDTVLRQAGPWTPTIHRLLVHLRERGFTAAALPLGVTDDGREVLTFVPVDVPVYPLPEWVWADARLDETGAMLRAWHDASRGFDTAGAVWQSAAVEPAEVVLHGDFAPHNLVFDEQHRLTGVIDVDFAAPGPRVRDVAYLATRIVPLSAEHEPAFSTLEAARARLDRLLAAYGPGRAPAEVLGVARDRLLELADFSDGKAVQLGKPHLHEDARSYRADAAWLAEATPRLLA